MAQKLTIVGAMKLRKRLAVKTDDLLRKIKENHAHMETASPVYKEKQAEVVKGWMQACRDITKHMEHLSLSIQKTNLQTEVEVILDGKPIKKSIAAWVLRRRELAPLDLKVFLTLNDNGLKEQAFQDPNDKTAVKVVKVVRHYDPTYRDKMKDLFAHEPSRIDAALETANATTELLDPPVFDEDKLLQE